MESEQTPQTGKETSLKRIRSRIRLIMLALWLHQERRPSVALFGYSSTNYFRLHVTVRIHLHVR